MIGSRGGLAIAEIVFWSPTLIIGVFLCIRHGFGRSQGWIFISILSLLRLIGSSCELYIVTKQDYDISLLTTAAICEAIGTAPLLLALSAFMSRVHKGMEHKSLPPSSFRPILFFAIAGLALAIVGGTLEADGGSVVQTGRDLMKAASIMFLAVWVIIAGIVFLTVMRINAVLPQERNLAKIGLMAIPFLLVRVIYTICSAFSHPGSIFYMYDINVYVEAFMQFMMEAIVVCIYITAGLSTPKAPQRAIHDGSQQKNLEGRNVEMINGPKQETGYAGVVQQLPGQYAAPQRRIGDYRPSRLIRTAISGRR
ncbi:hypothetical protein M433DRAFT_158816 [Acidomyces richmondensis BFW]|nr:MAG: hypothetical protein FE78DRAFT_86280 [Acidomyces sp. 'richmondensis']KYG41615.1 hypothetical protein M433DRAFT_158816 [Acidomyces richmondensis BFW]